MPSGLQGDLKGTNFFGVAVVGIFLGGGLVWSVQAPLSGAVVAHGVIGFETKRKTVQSLEGGIIKKILIKELGRRVQDRGLERFSAPDERVYALGRGALEVVAAFGTGCEIGGKG